MADLSVFSVGFGAAPRNKVAWAFADPFGSFLDETVQGEKVNNRTLVVQRFKAVEEIRDCHVLFISKSEVKQVNEIISQLKDRNILTVSDADGFAKSGVMIRFFKEKSKIRLRINIEAAKTAELSISSKLLRLAEIVSPGKE